MNIDASKDEEQPGEMEENPLENDFSSRKYLGLAIHTGHDDTDDAASEVGPVTGGSMVGAGADTVEDGGHGSTGEDEDGDSQADPADEREMGNAAPKPEVSVFVPVYQDGAQVGSSQGEGSAGSSLEAGFREHGMAQTAHQHTVNVDHEDLPASGGHFQRVARDEEDENVADEMAGIFVEPAVGEKSPNLLQVATIHQERLVIDTSECSLIYECGDKPNADE